MSSSSFLYPFLRQSRSRGGVADLLLPLDLERDLYLSLRRLESSRGSSGVRLRFLDGLWLLSPFAFAFLGSRISSRASVSSMAASSTAPASLSGMARPLN